MERNHNVGWMYLQLVELAQRGELQREAFGKVAHETVARMYSSIRTKIEKSTTRANDKS